MVSGVMVSGTDSTSPVRARLTEEDVGADEKRCESI